MSRGSELGPPPTYTCLLATGQSAVGHANGQNDMANC
eukprot:CAMPEP_0202920048 /NCGR_PEP_ID=MMETSP1392-20130828/76655_1 /ASSEMBLY_ACC=CAM_ASM_000868 /TAXON_ID=225041 /ORGANISM="Chlamydomonas chlamydogama, Strain SAG 11-48b" /LENGTH=36 /DNA_ID= /DNA_START= /DNA_END= /DNA_ORIENTATION=